MRSQTVRRAGDGGTPSHSASTSSHLAYCSPYRADVSLSSEVDPAGFHLHPWPHQEPEYCHTSPANLPSSASPSLSMNTHAGGAPGKTSSDSGTNAVALDRWSQRRLQRLNTEQGFREQRQGGPTVLSPPATAAPVEQQSYIQSSGGPSQHTNVNAQPQQPLHHQPHPQQQQAAYQNSRTAPGLVIQTQTSTIPPLRSPAFQSQAQAHLQLQQQQQQQQEYTPPESHSHYVADNADRPALNSARSFSAQTDDSSSMSNNGAMAQPKAVRNGNNRQSVHNDLRSREGSHSTQGSQMPAFSAAVVPPSSQGQPYKGNGGQTQQQPPQAHQQQQQHGEVGRATPQPLSVPDEMNDDEVSQLLKDHKELRKTGFAVLPRGLMLTC